MQKSEKDFFYSSGTPQFESNYGSIQKKRLQVTDHSEIDFETLRKTCMSA